MLKFEDFQQPLDKSLTPFKFQQLYLVSSSNALSLMYNDAKGNKFSLLEYDCIQEVKIIDNLSRIGVILNYVGTLMKDAKIFVFYKDDCFESLGSYAQRMLARKQRTQQRFCIQYFQSFVFILSEIQKQRQFMKILDPYSIGLRNPQNQNTVGFGLLLPFPCKNFNCITKQQYEQSIKFVAPQIIRYFVGNPNQQYCQKQFRKSSLYSIGLILLMCFGDTFTAKQRVEASRNDKQFRNLFKKIRKEIKIMHNGKFVPKVLKLLLQDCQKSRQILQTFIIKLRSQQFQSLKICKNVNMNDYKFFSTISDSNKSQIMKSQKTITMQINQNNTSPLTLTPISAFTPKPKIQQPVLNQKYQQINSPFHIEVSYQDQSPFQSRKTKIANSIKQNQQFRHESQQIKQQKYIEIPLRKYNLNDYVTFQHLNNQFRNQIKQPEDEIEVYRYNADQIHIGRNDKEQKMGTNKLESELQDQFQMEDQQNYDEKSILRRKFQNQSKVIMGVILLGFFLYASIGYLRQSNS